VIDHWITAAVFIAGVAMGIVATILYVQAARRRLAQLDAGEDGPARGDAERSSST
jgi:hypothetical protein